MNRNLMRGLAAAIALAAAAVVPTTAAEAARVYNFTPFQIAVGEMVVKEVLVDSGGRSQSLEWSNILPITVAVPSNSGLPIPICGFDLKHEMLVGGHYMVVSALNSKTLSCSLCDSDHHELARKTFDWHVDLGDFVSKHVGC